MKNNTLKLIMLASAIIINLYCGEKPAIENSRLSQSTDTDFYSPMPIRAASRQPTKQVSLINQYLTGLLKIEQVKQIRQQEDISPLLETDENGNTLLHHAASKNDRELVRCFTEYPHIVKNIGKNLYGQTPLHLTLQQNKLSNLLTLHAFMYSSEESKPDLNAIDNEGNTPLSLTVENNCNTASSFLLYHKCDPNVTDSKGTPVLHLAIQLGHTAIAQALIWERATNLNVRDKYGNTALTLAFNQGNIDLCDSLLSFGANPNVPTKCDSHILLSAIKYNHTTLIERILASKIAPDLDVTSAEGYTPLGWAFEYININLCKQLVKKGANPNITTSVGDPLWLAAIKGSDYKELVNDLITCEKTNLELLDTQGNNVLDIAIERRDKKLLQLLADSHNPNIRTRDGIPFIIYALKNKDYELAKSLIMNKAINIDVKDTENNNVIDLAIQSNNEDICRTISHISTDDFKERMLYSAFYYKKKNLCKLLLPSNPNVEIYGKSILAYAFEQNNTDLCTTLLWKGANPNTEINDRPILACAFEQNNTELCQNLLWKGANPNIKTEDDEYLIFSAIEKGNTEVVNTILYCESVGDLELYLKNKAGQTLIDIAKDTKYSHPHLESAIRNKLEKQQTKQTA